MDADVSGATYVLTPREKQVLDRLITYGESNKLIAAALGCADRTIDKHMERIMTKTGLHKRCEIIVNLSALAETDRRDGAV